MAKRKPAGPRFSANPIRTIHGVEDDPAEPVAATDVVAALLARIDALEARVTALEGRRATDPPPTAAGTADHAD